MSTASTRLQQLKLTIFGRAACENLITGRQQIPFIKDFSTRRKRRRSPPSAALSATAIQCRASQALRRPARADFGSGCSEVGWNCQPPSKGARAPDKRRIGAATPVGIRLCRRPRLIVGSIPLFPGSLNCPVSVAAFGGLSLRLDRGLIIFLLFILLNRC